MKCENFTELRTALEKDVCFLLGFTVKLMEDPDRVLIEGETNLKLLSDCVLDTLESYRNFDQVISLMIETVKKRNHENAKRGRVKLSSRWRNGISHEPCCG